MVKTEKIFDSAMAQTRDVERLFIEHSENCSIAVDNSTLRQNVEKNYFNNPQSGQLSTVNITKPSESQDSLFPFVCSIITSSSGKRGDC